MSNETPILVTGAAGNVGSVGRSVVKLLRERGKSLRSVDVGCAEVNRKTKYERSRICNCASGNIFHCCSHALDNKDQSLLLFSFIHRRNYNQSFGTLCRYSSYQYNYYNAVVVVSAILSKSRIYCLVCSIILGLSSSVGRL